MKKKKVLKPKIIRPVRDINYLLRRMIPYKYGEKIDCFLNLVWMPAGGGWFPAIRVTIRCNGRAINQTEFHFKLIERLILEGYKVQALYLTRKLKDLEEKNKILRK